MIIKENSVGFVLVADALSGGVTRSEKMPKKKSGSGFGWLKVTR